MNINCYLSSLFLFPLRVLLHPFQTPLICPCQFTCKFWLCNSLHVLLIILVAHVIEFELEILFWKRCAQDKLTWLPDVGIHHLLAGRQLSQVLSLLVILGEVDLAISISVDDPLLKHAVEVLLFSLKSINLRVFLDHVHAQGLHSFKLVPDLLLLLSLSVSIL